MCERARRAGVRARLRVCFPPDVGMHWFGASLHSCGVRVHVCFVCYGCRYAPVDGDEQRRRSANTTIETDFLDALTGTSAIECPPELLE